MRVIKLKKSNYISRHGFEAHLVRLDGNEVYLKSIIRDAFFMEGEYPPDDPLELFQIWEIDRKLYVEIPSESDDISDTILEHIVERIDDIDWLEQRNVTIFTKGHDGYEEFFYYEFVRNL